MKTKTKKQKRILIVGSGGLRGAYNAGVLAELCRKLGPDYFNTIIASSVGVYAATFYMANQPRIIENTWRNYVDSNKLVNFANKFKGKNILDLDYLSNIFQSRLSKLNVEKVVKSKVNLKYVLTDYKSGKPVYFIPKKDNIFELMKASSAIFPLYPPVKINKKLYIDGGLSEPLPFRSEFANSYDKIIVVHNKEKDYKERKAIILFFDLFSHFLPKKISILVDNYFDKLEKTKGEMKKYKNVFLLEPSKKILLKSLIDTNKKKINNTVNLGIKDAQKVINFL